MQNSNGPNSSSPYIYFFYAVCQKVDCNTPLELAYLNRDQGSIWAFMLTSFMGQIVTLEQGQDKEEDEEINFIIILGFYISCRKRKRNRFL